MGMHGGHNYPYYTNKQMTIKEKLIKTLIEKRTGALSSHKGTEEIHSANQDAETSCHSPLHFPQSALLDVHTCPETAGASVKHVDGG